MKIFSTLTQFKVFYFIEEYYDLLLLRKVYHKIIFLTLTTKIFLRYQN